MATGGEAVLGPEWDCPICMELYRDPKVLQCGHSMCNSCVRDLVHGNQRTLLCPVCRTVCPLQGALPTNYALLGVIDKHRKESMKCEQCGKRAIIADVWLCRTCANLTICSACAMKSHRNDGHEMEDGDMLIKRQQDENSDWKQKLASLDEKKDQITERMTRLEQKLAGVVTTVIDVAAVFGLVKTDLQKKINDLNAFKQKLDSLGIGGVGNGSQLHCLTPSFFSADLQENKKELVKWNQAQNQCLTFMDSMLESVEKSIKDQETSKARLALFAKSMNAFSCFCGEK